MVRAAYPVIPRLRTLELSESLVALGWPESHRTGRSIDSKGDPIPWWTYSAIHHVARHLEPTDRVFEWGPGASTRWLAGRVGEVVSVEHDPAWMQTYPDNVEVHLVGLDDYPAFIGGLGPFDVVVIDGRRRNDCARHVAAELSPGGVVVWDNSDRDYYDLSIFDGWQRIDFSGLGPVVANLWTTSVFWR